MAYTGVKLSADKYFNKYEHQYNLLRENSKFYSDAEEFDKAWKSVQSGNNTTYRSLDDYIRALDFAAQQGIDDQKLQSIYDAEMFDPELKITALYAETMADRTTLKDREKILTNEYGQPIKDSEGNVQIQTFQSSDYDYLKELIDDQLKYKREEWNNKLQQDLKDQMNFFAKRGADLVALLGEAATGITGTLEGFLSFMNGIGEGIKTFNKTGNLELASEARVNATIDPIFKEAFSDLDNAILDFERRYSDIRKFNGEYTTFGKYLGGVAHTLGMMVPSILVGKVTGGIGSKVSSAAAAGTAAKTAGNVMMGVGSASSQLLFYEALDAESIQEMYEQSAREGISVSSASLLANADIKAALQWGVEVGLAKLLGGSTLDNIVWGRQSAKITGETLGKAGTRRLFHDFLEEGLEETLQDTSDLFTNKVFDWLLDSNFNKLQSITSYDMFDSFIMGALASFAGSAARIVTTRKLAVSTSTPDGQYSMPERLGKLASWEYGLNMQSILSSYQSIVDFAKEAKAKNDVKALKASQAAFFELYAACRMISSVAGSIGEERANKARDILDTVTEAINDGQFDDINFEEQAKIMRDEVLSSHITLKYTGEVKSAIKLREKLEKLNKVKYKAKKGEPKDLTKPATVVEKLQKIFESNPDITDVKVTKYGKDVVVAESTMLIPENMLELTEGVINFALADGAIIDSVLQAINNKVFLVTEGDLTKLKNIYKNYKSVDNVGMRELAASLCYDSDFISEVLYNKDVNSCIFELIMRLQKSVSKPNSAFDVDYNAKIKTITDNIKNIIRGYIIDNGIADEYSDYNLFTKEEYAEIESARFEKNLYDKISVDYKSVTDAEWSRLKNLLTRASTNGKIIGGTVDEVIDILKKGGVTVGDKKYTITSVLNSVMAAIGMKWLGDYDGKTYLVNNSSGNRAFNRFLRNKGLTLKTIVDQGSLSEEDVAFAENNKIKSNKAFDIFISQFEVMTDGLYNVQSSYDGKIFAVVPTAKYKTVIPSKSFLQESVKGKVAERIKSAKDIQYQTKSFDTDVEYDVVNNLINPDSNDIVKSSTTLDNIVKDPSLLKDSVLKDIANKYGQVNEDTTFLYVANYIENEYKNTFTVGISNQGKAVLCTNYKFDSFLKVSYEELVNILRTAKNPINFSELFTDEVLFGSLKNAKIIVTDLQNSNGNITYNSETGDVTIFVNSKYIAKSDLNCINVLQHEFQHAIQLQYKLNSGGTKGILFDEKFNIKKSIKNPDVIGKICKKLATRYNVASLGDFEHNKIKWYNFLSDIIYYNSGELFAHGLNNLAFELGIPVVWSDNRATNELEIHILGETIRITGQKTFRQLSSPIFSDAYSLLNIESDLDSSLYNFVQGPLSLTEIDTDNIDVQDRQESRLALYKALGGSKQFAKGEDFKNAKIPVVYFEKPGTKVYDDYVIGTVANIDKDIIEQIVGHQDGKLYVSYMTPVQVYYFVNNPINNIIVKKSQVFADNDIMFSYHEAGVHKLMYRGDIIDGSTQNVEFKEAVEADVEREEEKEVVSTDRETVTDEQKKARNEEVRKRKDEESNKLLEKYKDKISRLEKKYGAKAIRAEREKGGKNKQYDYKVTVYFDRSIKGGNVDYHILYEYEKGHTKGVSISDKTEGPLKNFAGKNRSPEFKEFVTKSADMKLPALLQKKINDGTLTSRDIIDYVRSTPYDKMDNDTFRFINECYFHNKYITSIEQLEALTEDNSKLWAAARLFFQMGKQDLLEHNYSTNIIEEVTAILEEDTKYAEAFAEYQTEYTEKVVSNKYLRTLYMRMFDGTLVSAYRAAKFAKMAVDANWQTTGDIQTVRGESEHSARKDSTYTTDISDAAYVSSDEEYFGPDHELYTATEKQKIKFIMEMWKKRAIVSVAEGVKTLADFGGDFGRAESKQKQRVMEALFDDPVAFEKAFQKAKGLKNQINQMYMRALAAEATGNDDYLYDVGTVEKVIKYVNNSDRTPRNIAQNIRHIVNTIRANLSVAERKAFLKNNGDIFNDDLTLKDGVISTNENGRYRYVDKSLLIPLEERVRELSILAQSHELSDSKQKKIRNRTERIIRHQESEIERLKLKAAKTRETVRTINVSDVELTVTSDVPVPVSFMKLLETEFDKTAEGQVQFSNVESQEHVKIQVSKFLEDNAEFLRQMSSSEANDIVDYFLSSSLIPTTNKFRTYLGVEICVITYILKDAQLDSPQFQILTEKIKQLDELFTSFQSIFGTGLATIRSAVETIDPTKIILKRLSQSIGVEIDDNDIYELTRAVKSGSYVNMAEAQKKIYENLKEKYKGRKVNIFDKLLKFSRVAMLSSPGTWVRNWTSNYIVSFFNKLAEKTGSAVTNIIDKLFPKAAERRSDFAKSEKLYRDLQKIKISDEYKTFIDNDVVASGLLELIQDGLSKYNDEYLRGKSYSNILVKMIASGIRNKFMYNEEGGNKYLSAWYKFIYKRIADDKWVNKAFIRYLGKTLTYDKVDVSQGMTTEVMKHIADAYTLAAEDYMHKTNFINTVERALRSKIGPAGFFVYKSIFPFLSASMNWFLEGLKYTPFGLANAIIKYARLENTVDKMSNKNQQGEGVSYRFAEYLTSRDIGKGVIGTIGFAIGCMLAGFGIAGLDDKDDKIKLHIGDVYIDITGLFGTQGIMTGLSIVTAATKGNNASFMNVLKTTLDQMFMDSTISNMYNTVRYSTSAGDFLLSIPFNMASNFVPNIIGVASAANVYQNKYEKGIVGKLEKLLLKAMPTISYALPKTIDVYTGEKKIAYKLSPLVKFINKMGPVDFYPYKISALEKKALELGLSSNGLRGKFTVDNKTISFGTKDTQYFNEMYGKLNNKHLTEFVNNKVKYKVLDKKTNKYVELTYSKMTDEQRKNVFERIMSKNENTVKIYALTSSGKYKYYTTYEEYQALEELGIRKNVYTKTDKVEGYKEIK